MSAYDPHCIRRARTCVPRSRRADALHGPRTPEGRLQRHQGTVSCRDEATVSLRPGNGSAPTPRPEGSVVRRHPSRGLLSPLAVPDYPGRRHFGPGRANVWVLLLRLRLTTKGWAEEQRESLARDKGLHSARAWDDGLRAACTRFQLAHGRRGELADGYPDDETWRLLWMT